MIIIRPVYTGCINLMVNKLFLFCYVLYFRRRKDALVLCDIAVSSFTSSIPIAEEMKPPHIAKSYRQFNIT
jgi:hypothetical protein